MAEIGEAMPSRPVDVGRSPITGALSTVSDAAAKAVLQSILACLVATGSATDATT